MPISTLLLFVLGLVTVGIVVYLPFCLWFARNRRKGEQVVSGKYGAVVPREQYPWLLLFVAVLLAAFMWGELNPDTWLGQLMRLPGGHWALRWILGVAFILVAWGWYKLRSRKRTDAEAARGETE